MMKNSGRDGMKDFVQAMDISLAVCLILGYFIV